MNNQVLISLIKQLNLYGLVPSKQKSVVLANFSEDKVDLLLKLISSYFVTQSNLNYVILEISKIKGKINLEEIELKELFRFDNKKLNSKVLKFMLNELKNNTDSATHKIKKLSNIIHHSNELLTISYNDVELIDIIDDKRFRQLDLTSAILGIYEMISVESLEKLMPEINSFILNDDVLDVVKKIDDKDKRKKDYYGLLDRYLSVLYEYYNERDLLNNIILISLYDKNDLSDATKLLNVVLLYSLNIKEMETLGSILCRVDNFDKIDKIVAVLKYYDQHNSKNLASLTEKIFKTIPKDKFDNYYNEIIEAINISGNSPKREVNMEKIYDSLSLLLSNRGFIKYLDENGFDFLKCLLYKYNLSKEYMLIANSNLICVNMEYKTYSKLLNSFQVESLSIRDTKAKIYSDFKVISLFKVEPQILRKLNYVIDNNSELITPYEIELLKNPKFLKSNFFDKEFFDLHDRLAQLDNNSVEIFWKILGTFNFDDPNFSIYVQNLLAVDNIVELASIYMERLKNKEDSFVATIGDSLYDVLTSNDKEKVDNYLNMLSSISANTDIKADTKTIYQKKLGKKEEK